MLLLVLGVVFLTPDKEADNVKEALGEIGAETEDFIDNAKESYQKYSTEFVEEANEAINEAVEGAVKSASESFFESIRQAVGEFFENLIPG